MMVTKIQLAAMGRADVPEAERRPFYLYVDEFQVFATESFATILSEARKYALNLTVANQYISQMEEPVRNAVFGNVGTIVCFRVSPDDAPFLVKYFEPQFEAGDLIQQHNRYFVATMTIGGEKAPAFSAKTLNLPEPPDDSSSRIIELSRERYTKDRASVDALIRKNTGLDLTDLANNPQAAPQVARPKAQAQLNEIAKQRAETARSGAKPYGGNLGKIAASLLSNVSSDSGGSTGAPKRKRTRRGGRKNQGQQRQDGGATTQRQKQADSSDNKLADSSDEYIVRFR
jgi:hypothetical protein